MKQIAILMLAMATAAPVQAEEAAGMTCTTMGDLAQNIMRARQNGVSPALLVKVTTEPLPEQARQAMQNFVMSAYQIPRFSTPENVERAVQDFRAMTELGCLQGDADSAQGE